MNTDRLALVHERTATHEWVPASRAAHVLRRRVFRYGPHESGRVSSIARYMPGAAFPTHPHPQGEEILVLDGVFSDWRGDHVAGTFLLNPDGFEHAPSSKPGCTLFVRLRQYPGSARPQKAVDTNALPWDADHRKLLVDNAFGDRQFLQRVAPPSPAALAVPPHGLELFVVDGHPRIRLSNADPPPTDVNDLRANKHDWVRIPAPHQRTAVATVTVTVTVDDDGCDAVLLVKENTLRSAFAPIETEVG